MNKLRPIANEILNIKKEILNESHSEIIKKALEISVDRMLAEGFIDLEMHMCIKDSNFSYSELKKYILSSDKYLKTEEELLIEYDTLIKKLESYLANYDIDNYYINVDLVNDKINLCKVFSLDEGFLNRYFYIDGKPDEYIEKLLRKKGFMQQYAVLRFPRILSNFISMYPEDKRYKMNKSHSYYQTDKKLYSIDLVFSIDANVIEKMNETSNLLIDINNRINEAEAYFKEKTFD